MVGYDVICLSMTNDEWKFNDFFVGNFFSYFF